MKSQRIGSDNDIVGSQSLPLLSNRNNYIPKHLNVPKKKVRSLKNLQYDEPVADRILRENKKFMKPLSDLELIMKKFDE